MLYHRWSLTGMELYQLVNSAVMVVLLILISLIEFSTYTVRMEVEVAVVAIACTMALLPILFPSLKRRLRDFTFFFNVKPTGNKIEGYSVEMDMLLKDMPPGTLEWLEVHEEMIKNLFPSDWTEFDKLNMIQVAYGFKLIGLDWRSDNDLAKIFTMLEKLKLIERREKFVRRSATSLFKKCDESLS